MDEKNLNENTIEQEVLENEVVTEQSSQEPTPTPKSPKSKKAILIGTIALVAIVAVIALVLILGNRECEHQWGEYSIVTDANCVAEGVKERKCAECGETESEVIAALGHDWANATCTLPQTCKNCGETVGEALGHKDANFDHVCDNECGKNDMGEHSDSATDTDHVCDYGCDAVLEACADKENDGDHKCDVCAKEEITTHSYADASCEVPSTCTECGATSGDPLGHKDENHDHVCDNECGKNNMGEHSDSNTDSDHVCDYGCGAVLKNCADAINDGDHTCDICGKENVSEHDYIDATCETPKTCFECGATSGDPLGHKDEDHDHSCDNDCGKTDMGEHSDSATDTDHICDYGCGAVLNDCVDSSDDDNHNCDVCGKANVTQHDYSEQIMNNSTLKNTASCNEAETYYYTCNCGDVSESETFTSGTALGHSYVLESETAATCDSPASATYKCACGDTYTETIGDKLEHNIEGVTPVERQINGCEYALVYICDREGCGAEIVGETQYRHTFVASVDKYPTCTEEGLKILTCACGKTEEEVIEANSTGHSWILGTVVGNERVDECSICGEQKTVVVYTGESTNSTKPSDLADKEIQLNDTSISLDSGIIDLMGDNNVVISAGKLTEAEKNGLGLSEKELEQVGNSPIYDFSITDGVKTYDKFGESFVTISLPYELQDGDDVDSIAVWYIDKNGDLQSIEAVYNNGYVTFKTNHFSYYTVTRLTPEERCAIYKHSFVTYTQQGSCTKDGYELNVCVRCHYQEYVSYTKADGHDYTYAHSDATCTDGGYSTYTCNDCGHSYGTKVNALGHAYTQIDWVWSNDYSNVVLSITCANDSTHTVVLNPTVEVEVEALACCDYVKTTYTATVSYNGFEFVDTKTVEVGTVNHKFSSEWTNKDGEHWHECVCGEKSDYSKHVFENDTITKEPTCTVEGESTSYCVCGETKVVSVPATKVHIYVDGFCQYCGIEEIICDHTEFHTETLNMADFGGCNWSFDYETCLCGQEKHIDIEELINMASTCSYYEIYYNTTDSEGRIVYGCSRCDLTLEIIVNFISNDCVEAEEYWVDIKFGDTVIIEDLYGYDSYRRHQTPTIESVDLSTFGACGGTVTVAYCNGCGEYASITKFKDMLCNVNFNVEPEFSIVVDENGVEHKVGTVKCSDCSLEFTIDLIEDRINSCEYSLDATLTLSCNGKVIASVQTSKTYDEHNTKNTYELLGDTCEDGVKAIYECTKCDFSYETTVYYHMGSQYQTIDLSQYGLCGGTVEGSVCSYCGEMVYLNEYNFVCNFTNEVKEDITDENGKVIGYQITSTCADCGITVVQINKVESLTSCTYARTENTLIYKGSDLIFNFDHTGNEAYYFEEHSFETTYELTGTDCSEPYKVIQTCTQCGLVYEFMETGHYEENVVIDLAELGGCGGFMAITRCAICKLALNSSDGNIECPWFDDGTSPTVETVIRDGVEVEIATQTCLDCKLRFVTEEWEFVDGCVRTTYMSAYIYAGNDCVFEFSQSNTSTSHDYYGNSMLYGNYEYITKGYHCSDGYYQVQTCVKCGYKDINNNGGHGYYTTPVIIPLSQYGMCGGQITASACAACNEILGYSDYQLDACTWQYVETNAEGLEVYECTTCGAIKQEYVHQSAKNDKCQYTGTIKIILTINGQEIVNYQRENTYTEHDYEYSYVAIGNNCQNGYIEIQKCKDCDYFDSYNYGGGGHYTKSIDLSDKLTCCNNDHFYLQMCPCGYNFEFYPYGNYTEKQENGAVIYEWANCGLTVRLYSSTQQSGCVQIIDKQCTMTLNGEVIFEVENTIEAARHQFSSYNWEIVDGKEIVVATCNLCGETRTNEIIEFTIDKSSAKNGYVYYYFTPEETGNYYFEKLAYSTNSYTNLYKLVGDKLVYEYEFYDGNSNHNHENSAKLYAGVTYAIGFSTSEYQDKSKVKFTILPANEFKCAGGDYWYGGYTTIATLLETSSTCKDGIRIISACLGCGTVSNCYVSYEHYRVNKYIDLQAEYGACSGYISYYSCACGEIFENPYFSHCGYTTHEEYYEGNQLMFVETRYCSSCGMRTDDTYYKVKDGCTLISYHTFTVSKNGELIFSGEYEEEDSDHNYEYTFEFMKDGTTCNDGVYVHYLCKDCGYSGTYNTYGCSEFEKERIDLASLGSVCGGYVIYKECPCGRQSSLSFEHTLCDFGTRDCDMWVKDYLTGSQPSIEYRDFYWNSYMYVCAVTDPASAACAFKIRYAEYWLKDENSCNAYQYRTWQFGYDEATDTCLYEITIKTNSVASYHNYVNTSANGNIKLDCADCGSYYYENWYYDANGYLEKYERFVSNTLNNGHDKYYERIEEYDTDADGNRYCSREYYRYIYADDSEYWSEYLREEESYTGTFGNPGKKVTTTYSSSDGDNYTTEQAYVIYQGYTFTIYNLRTYTYTDYWTRYDYTYDFSGPCTRTEKYSDSDGKDYVRTYENCHYGHYISIKDATCTQVGEYGYGCPFCGNMTETYTYSPYDHDWWYDGNIYYCCRCGLENDNGASGSIIMEDMTASYGNNENYVVGYYNWDKVQFSKYVSLILSNGDEVIIESIKFTEIEGLVAYAFSIADVEAFAKDNGYSDYQVRFTFVPYGADSSFDYAITFD